MLAKRSDDLEVLELACRAYLGTGNYIQAQPLCWKLYQAKPERVDLVLQTHGGPDPERGCPASVGNR